LFAGLELATFGNGAFLFWMPTILARAFGYSAAKAGESFGLAFGIGSISGTILAAVLTRLLRKRWDALASLQTARIGAIAVAAVVPFVLLVRSAEQLLVFAALFVALCYVAISVSPNIQTAIAPNHLRGRVITITGLIGLVSSTVWPPLIGFLSDKVFHGPLGLLQAFSAIVIPSSLVALLFLARIAAPFRRTLSLPLETKNASSL
jgi:MFS family permease